MSTALSTFGFAGGTGIGVLSGVTITVSSVAAGYSATALASRSLSPIVRSVTGVVSGWQIDVDFGAGVTQDVGVVVLGGTNLPTAGGTWRVRGGTDATFAATLFDSGTVAPFDTTYRSTRVPPGGRNAVYVVPTSQACRYVRIIVTGGGSLTDNFLRASYLICGSLEQPERGFDKTSMSRGTVTQGEGVVEITLRTLLVTLFRAFKDQEVFLLDVCAKAGKNGRVYIIPQPLSPASFLPDAYLATFVQDPASIPVPQLIERYAITVSFQEADR